MEADDACAVHIKLLKGNVKLNPRSDCVVVTALVTDFDRWQLDVFLSTASLVKERSERKKTESVSKSIMAL